MDVAATAHDECRVSVTPPPLITDDSVFTTPFALSFAKPAGTGFDSNQIYVAVLFHSPSGVSKSKHFSQSPGSFLQFYLVFLDVFPCLSQEAVTCALSVSES